MHAACAPALGAPPRFAIELADIVREHGEEFRRTHILSPEQHAVLSAIERCRTAELGGHLDVCLACGHSQPSYNSCRNRHCPKCQALSQARWVEGRMARILPVHYFHVVFTLPAQLRKVARRNPRRMYELLFAAVSETLLELGHDSKWLGAKLGITSVLHTWTRELVYHPHVHCIVTGGGLSCDGEKWLGCRPNFLFPVHVMGALFRAKMLHKIRQAHARRKLDLGPDTVDPEAFGRLLDQLYRFDWVVYSKRPFGGPEQVIRYLGRYTHRIAISNYRLVSLDKGQVTFRTKSGKSITLTVDEFLARFLQHVLPVGFVKIRHFGLMASSNATTKLEIARTLLVASERSENAGAPPMKPSGAPVLNGTIGWRELLLALTGTDAKRCPACSALALVRRPLPEDARGPPRRNDA